MSQNDFNQGANCGFVIGLVVGVLMAALIGFVCFVGGRGQGYAAGVQDVMSGKVKPTTVPMTWEVKP